MDTEPECITAKFNLQLAPFTGRVAARIRSGFAYRYMLSAARFCTLCAEIEEDNKGAKPGPFLDEVEAYATAAALLSAAALEANINTVYINATEGKQTLPGLSQNQAEELWPHFEEKPILKKYQLALVLCDQGKMNKGTEPYQSAYALKRVRDTLMHFKPEWHGEQNKHANLGKLLEGKFKLSPFIPSSAPTFPERCMCHGFAKWAVCSAMKFAGEFAEQLGAPNPISKSADRISEALQP